MSFFYKNLTIETDEQGYLLNYLDWSESLAIELALSENIELSTQHWEVIYVLQEFYKLNKKSMAIRALTKQMKIKYGLEKSSSLYLFKLFPQGPAKQASKIAGLPKPARCL